MKLSELSTKLKKQGNLKVYYPTNKTYYYINDWSITFYPRSVFIISDIPDIDYDRLMNKMISFRMSERDHDILLRIRDTAQYFRLL
jgi:hypothetical protein